MWVRPYVFYTRKNMSKKVRNYAVMDHDCREVSLCGLYNSAFVVLQSHSLIPFCCSFAKLWTFRFNSGTVYSYGFISYGTVSSDPAPGLLVWQFLWVFSIIISTLGRLLLPGAGGRGLARTMRADRCRFRHSTYMRPDRKTGFFCRGPFDNWCVQ